MKSKKKRWVCPLCSIGVLGPLRPRKDNALRYCLPCTGKTGKLTERVAPADIKKQERKAQQKEVTQERVAAKRKENPKTRNTKRSWMRDSRYVLSYEDRAFNIMEMAEKMCASSRWNAVVKKAAKRTQATLYNCTANRNMQHLWKQTMREKGAQGNRGGIRITRNNKSYATGRGGQNYGVTMGASQHNIADTMMCLLHELTHVAHLSQVNAARINDKRRPHDLMFNIIQWQMAKNFWGYDVHPYTAGYSVGKGYAPSRHLEQWLKEKLKEGDPKVMKWFTMEAPQEKEEEEKKPSTRPPKWEITQDGETLRVCLTKGTLACLDHYLDAELDDEEEERKREKLRDAIQKAEKEGHTRVIRIDPLLLPWLKEEAGNLQGEYNVLNEEPSWEKGLARILRAIQLWNEGKKWSVQEAHYTRNYRWGDPSWSGGTIKLIEEAT